MSKPTSKQIELSYNLWEEGVRISREAWARFEASEEGDCFVPVLTLEDALVELRKRSVEVSIFGSFYSGMSGPWMWSVRVGFNNEFNELLEAEADADTPTEAALHALLAVVKGE